jgi:hypothetical protein
MRRLAYRTAVCDNRSMKAVLPCKLQACLASLWVALCGLAAEPARVIFDFAAPLDTSRLTLQDARAESVETQGRRVLRVTTGHAAPWPGVTLPAPGGPVDLSAYAYVQLRARNAGQRPLTLYLRVDNPGADGVKHCRTSSTRLEPGATGTIRVDLKRTSDDRLGGRLFGMRGYPVRAGGEDTIDPVRITQFIVFLNRPSENHVFELLELIAAGTYTPPTAWSHDAEPYFPLIDTFGQYRHKSWPGKVSSLAELTARRDREAAEQASAADAFSRAARWNRYGGWAAGPQLEATGFFRVQKYQGKWWLVDPEGRLFWSHGITCVGMMDATPIEEREEWFEHPPWQQPELAKYILPSAFVLKGHYAGRQVRAYSFAAANLHRKYGPDWRSVYPPLVHQRLRAWGLNTIANWSDASVTRLRRTPYTDSVSSQGARWIEGSEGYWGKFPDVFDPSFTEAVRQSAASKVGNSAGDPWCLGYFSDNEMSWGDETSLALAALASPPDQPARREFVSDLQKKYGTIARLNEVWGTDFASWEALQTGVVRPDPARAGEDLRAFYTRVAETYFRTVRDALRAVAPHQLYLGCRFAWVNALAAAAAAKYCDVVSYNRYERSVAEFRNPDGADVPLLIGEFHFGALDRGLFHTGLVPVANQTERAAAYRSYVEGALRHPQIVGTHWFQYQDQPTTGRVYDEENYQIGFVDIADTPYPETIAASRAVGENLYRLRAGQ